MNTFTNEEIKILIENYNNGIPVKLLERHSKKTIYNKAIKLGLKKQNQINWNNEEIRILKEKYPKYCGDIPELLRRHNRYAITKKAQKLGITYKSRKHNKMFKINDEINGLIEGLLLGDAWVGSRNNNTAYLQIFQTKRNKEWLFTLKKIFEDNNINCSDIKLRRRAMNKIINKKRVFCNEMYGFNTSFYKTFFEYAIKWYPKGKKIVPNTVDLSPISLAQWYMGDGTLCKRQLQFATNGFDEHSCEILSNKLNDIYGWHPKLYTCLTLLRKNEISEFLELTRPYKVNCFNYKWKKEM